MQYRTSHATPDTEAGAIYAGQLSLVHTGSMALIGVCSRHTPDPAPRGTSQVGGAAGFLAAQGGPSFSTLKSAPNSPVHGLRATIFSVELGARACNLLGCPLHWSPTARESRDLTQSSWLATVTADAHPQLKGSGFLLWVWVAYACPTTASLGNSLRWST